MADDKPARFPGGSQTRRDAQFGIDDADFWRWWHRVGKPLVGEGDLGTRDRALDVYADWQAQGRPKVK